MKERGREISSDGRHGCRSLTLSLPASPVDLSSLLHCLPAPSPLACRHKRASPPDRCLVRERPPASRFVRASPADRRRFRASPPDRRLVRACFLHGRSASSGFLLVYAVHVPPPLATIRRGRGGRVLERCAASSAPGGTLPRRWMIDSPTPTSGPPVAGRGLGRGRPRFRCCSGSFASCGSIRSSRPSRCSVGSAEVRCLARCTSSAPKPLEHPPAHWAARRGGSPPRWTTPRPASGSPASAAPQPLLPCFLPPRLLCCSPSGRYRRGGCPLPALRPAAFILPPFGHELGVGLALRVPTARTVPVAPHKR